MFLWAKRHKLLVRADLKIILMSVWFYFILAFCALIVWSFTLIQPRDELTRIFVMDELQNAQSAHLIEELSQFGYRIEFTDDFDTASLLTKVDKAYAVIRIDRNGTIHHRVYSIMAEDIMEYTLRQVVEKFRFEQYQRSAIGGGAHWPEIESMGKPFLSNVNEGNDNVAVIIISGIWYLCGITTLVLWILSKDGFAKLMRIYSFFEILAARTVAGCCLGSILALVFFGTAAVLKIHFISLQGLIGTGLWSILTGVLSGLLLGAGALAAGGSILSLMMIGLLGITLLFLYLTIVSGIFIPIGGIPWILAFTSRWMPLFCQIELLRWSALGGHSLLDPICRGLMVQLGIINIAQFVLSMLFLRRV